MGIRLALLFLVLTALDAAPPKLRLGEVQKAFPQRYQAELTLNPEREQFEASIEIEISLAEPRSTLWLHQNHLSIQKAVVILAGKSIPAKVIPGGEDFVGFSFPRPLPAGTIQLQIHYTGLISSKSSSSIFRQRDNGSWYLFTQFEPSDARGAFPCFDEPQYKTPWQLTLHFPASLSAVSNTNPESDQTTGNQRTLRFRPTPPLPSYLIAFAVGNFEYVPAGLAGEKQVPVRIVVPRGHKDEAKYAAEVTAEIINRHEKYFGIPYPYEKADQLAIPDTSGFGAMENPGLITYAQNILLADPKADSIIRQRNYVRTAAHELAHQWFGDLVTSAWWDDIWLNESFATWMEDKYLADWKPAWKTQLSQVDAKLSVAAQDSLISARQIRQPIRVKDDINNAFDSISYQKGGAVLAMFEAWLGEGVFQQSIHNYLSQYANRATTAADLLDVLSSTTHKDITAAFSTFLNQPGIPLLRVALQCEPGKASLHLEQQRFLPTGSTGSTNQTWSFPVCVRYESNGGSQRECTLLSKPSADWTLNTTSCPAWVVPNADGKGYYRTELKDNLRSGDLTAAEKIEEMGNAEALASAGKFSTGSLLELVAKFRADPDRQVLTKAIDIALAPASQWIRPEFRANYVRFLDQSFGARARALGWTPRPKEDDETTLLRPILLSIAATYGEDATLAREARTLTDRWLSGEITLNPNLLRTVLTTAAYHGDRALFDRFLAAFLKTTDKLNRSRLIGAMSGFRDPTALRAGMDALITGKLPFLEGNFLLFNGTNFPETRHLPFEFLQANFNTIVKLMPTGGGFDFGSVLPQVGSNFCDAQSRDQLANFFTPRVSKFTGAPAILKQTLEGINLCIADKAQRQPGVEAFLRRF
ncbi:M1 family metallopeptidase [Bryobacter aggregatus]|uniref:M1 family metallopeptidase n=1 Tax=Bryobacter aggregatus TaxID=360054 RepID=UPI000690E95C|nr:M1 family metallopeptidase [Bryobacter aggregatus]